MSTNQRPDAVRVLDDYSVFYEVEALSDPPRVTYGGAYRDASWMIRSRLSMGKIACVPKVSQVVYAVEFRPLVRSYSATTGDVGWSAYVENYVQMRFEEQPDGGFRMYNGLANDHLITALAMPSSHVVLQYLRVGYMRQFVAIRTFLLDPEPGHGSLISEELPRIESFHEGGYVATFEDPFPRLEVRAFEGGQEFACLTSLGSRPGHRRFAFALLQRRTRQPATFSLAGGHAPTCAWGIARSGVSACLLSRREIHARRHGRDT